MEKGGALSHSFMGLASHRLTEEKVRPCIYCVCVCIYYTQKFYEGISCKPVAPSLLGRCWLRQWCDLCVDENESGEVLSFSFTSLFYVGINVASGSLGEGKEKEKDPLLNPEKDSRGLVFGEKPSYLNRVEHLHIRTALIKSPFKIKPI